MKPADESLLKSVLVMKGPSVASASTKEGKSLPRARDCGFKVAEGGDKPEMSAICENGGVGRRI
jgi:hypothetical protein